MENTINAQAQNPYEVMLNAMQQMLMPAFKQYTNDRINAVLKKVEDLQPAVREHTIKIGDVTGKVEGIVHEKFDLILTMLANGRSVYLYGPAGSGKNHTCEQVAQAMGLKFYYTNCVTQEYKLTGFVDARGEYQPTQFYHAFKEGGVFMLDELDASIPDVLVNLNAALANGYFVFPNDERVQAHPDFHCIAAGNTCGKGANEMYTGRAVLDAASLNRFIPVDFDYDKDVEKALAQGNNAALQFYWWLQQAVKNTRINHVVGYRTLSNLVKLAGTMADTDVVKYTMFGGLEQDEITLLINDIERASDGKCYGNKYYTAATELKY